MRARIAALAALLSAAAAADGPAARPSAILTRSGAPGETIFLKDEPCADDLRSLVRSRELDGRIVTHAPDFVELRVDDASWSNWWRRKGFRARIQACSRGYADMFRSPGLLDRVAEIRFPARIEPGRADAPALRRILRAFALLRGTQASAELKESLARELSRCLTDFNMLASTSGLPEFRIDTDSGQVEYGGRPFAPAPPVADRGLLSVAATGGDAVRRLREVSGARSLDELAPTWERNRCMALWRDGG